MHFFACTYLLEHTRSAFSKSIFYEWLDIWSHFFVIWNCFLFSAIQNLSNSNDWSVGSKNELLDKGILGFAFKKGEILIYDMQYIGEIMSSPKQYNIFIFQFTFFLKWMWFDVTM